MERLSDILGKVLAGVAEMVAEREGPHLRGSLVSREEPERKTTGAEALHELTTDAVPPVSLVVQSSRDGAPEGRNPRVRAEDGHASTRHAMAQNRVKAEKKVAAATSALMTASCRQE